MNRGLYHNTSALLTINKDMNVKTQNISNVNTHGYKYDKTHTKTFNEVMISYKGQNLGIIPSKIGVEEIQTIFTQGPLIATERILDLGITGEGFFKIDTVDGNTAYTRDGNFHIDSQGYIVNNNGHYLLGEKGRIKIPDGKNISINKEGNIISNGVLIDKISIVNISNANKTGQNYFTGTNEVTSNANVHSGYLEGSNVDISTELTDVITLQRLMTMNTKAIQTHDTLNEKLIKDISK